MFFAKQVIILFAVYSYALDYIFIYKIDKANTNEYIYSIFDYAFYFLILAFPIAIPILYNYALLSDKNRVQKCCNTLLLKVTG